jgi:hypothetical protein
LLTHLVPVQAGQQQVEQQKIEVPFHGKRETGLAIVGHDTEMALGRQSALEKVSNPRLVFNDQYSHATTCIGLQPRNRHAQYGPRHVDYDYSEDSSLNG